MLSAGSQEWRWFIRYYENGKKRERSTGWNIDNRAEAELVLASFLQERAEAASAIPDGPKRPDQMTCGQVLTLYEQQHGALAADPTRISNAILALTPFWATVRVIEIKGEMCRHYLKSRTKRQRIPDTDPPQYRNVPIAEATVRRELGTLAAALNHCQREGYLMSAPSVWLPPASPPRETYLSRSELARLVRAARRDPRSRWRLPMFIMIAFYTGRRKEAILALQWQPNTQGGHVDLKTGIIDFRPVGRSETAKRRGKLQAPKRLLRLLRYARRRTRQFVLEYGRDSQNPITNIRRSFATAAAAAGLDPRLVTPHVLRHTCISYLAQSGLPLWEACAWVDVTMETAERVYAHHDGRHTRARELFDRGGRTSR